jgi:hypothetical protein
MSIQQEAKMAETNPAVKEQLAKDAEARKKATAEYATRMENAKPTPTQEENDRARLGDDVAEKQDDGSGPEAKIMLTHRVVEADKDRPAAASYSTRQTTAAKPAGSHS